MLLFLVIVIAVLALLGRRLEPSAREIPPGATGADGRRVFGPGRVGFVGLFAFVGLLAFVSLLAFVDRFAFAALLGLIAFVVLFAFAVLDNGEAFGIEEQRMVLRQFARLGFGPPCVGFGRIAGVLGGRRPGVPGDGLDDLARVFRERSRRVFGFGDDVGGFRRRSSWAGSSQTRPWSAES